MIGIRAGLGLGSDNVSKSRPAQVCGSEVWKMVKVYLP